MLCITTSYSQVNCVDNNKTSCTIDSSNHVFDYFNQKTDTLFCEYGRTILMDCLPYFRDTKPTYVIRKSTYEEEFNGYGLLDVFIENKLLFRKRTLLALAIIISETKNCEASSLSMIFWKEAN